MTFPMLRKLVDCKIILDTLKTTLHSFFLLKFSLFTFINERTNNTVLGNAGKAKV